METIFWTSIGLIVYCYFGYPLIIFILAKFLNRRVKKSPMEPTVSVVLSVYNEEDVIEKKISNLLSLDYPKDKIEFLIGSDGSYDCTDEIVKACSDKRVQLVVQDRRKGKMVTINELVKRAKNDVVVFTDARQEFAKNAIQELVANFSDPKVGCVSGELIFKEDEGATAKGVSLYWSYEKFIRAQESKLHSMLGATGAIYAIRKELYKDIPKDVVLDDMYIPLNIIKSGYRAIFDDSAKAYDEPADSPKQEHRRKARTLYGNYQIFGLFLGSFVPVKSPVAIQLFSHKFLRVIIPFLLILIFLVNIMLTAESLYANLFIAQITFYNMAILGGLLRYEKYGILKVVSRICYIPYVFCLLNFSAFVGFLRFARSTQEITWEKARD